MADKIDAPEKDQPKGELDFVRQWLDAIELAEKEEAGWIKTAERACDTYRGGPGKGSFETNLTTFNIFHSNVETLVPALYNSTPIPDVRRRYNDADPVAKDVSELLERSLSYSVDSYDFDQLLLTTTRDMALVSRGIARVRYVPTMDANGMVAYEAVPCEYVPWKSFRRGPAKVWSDVPWIAFELYLSHSECEKLLADEPNKATILKGLRFAYTPEPKANSEQRGENVSSLAARAHVWEIWDKDNRKVHFISPDYAARRLVSLDDPLELTDFFPTPRPLAAIMSPDSLVPVTMLQVYERLLEELNIIQRRIMALTAQCRARGWYAGLNDTDIQLAAEAEDGTLTPLTGAEVFVTQGTGLDKAITYWPLETIVAALKQLMEQREFIKGTIYEVTGISDIVRGASDARETATAQQIKSQWGSLRIQRMQAEVARFARDLFRLKAEVMARKFSFETFQVMTGMTFPTAEEKAQAQQYAQMVQDPAEQKQIAEMLAKPSREDIEKLLRNDSMRGFSVDIESDSTVRGDLQKSQEQMALFLQGTAQYMQAVGPMVQEGVVPPDLALEIFAGFARSFRLGKQAEDALDKLADQIKKSGPQQKPNPEEVRAQAEQRKLEMEMKAKEQEFGMKQQLMQFDMQLKREGLELKRAELDMKREELGLEMQAAQQQMAMDQQKMALDQEYQQTEHAMNLQSRQQEHALNTEAMSEKHAMGMQAMEEKAEFQRRQQQQRRTQAA